jgi:CRP-like cAMP-binding protein
MMPTGDPVLLLPIVRKLERSGLLHESDRQAILSLAHRTALLPAGAHIVREGDRVEQCCAMLSGFAGRHKLTGQGSKQIVSLHLRGDLVDLHNLLFGVADHSVQALTACEVAFIAKDAMLDLIEERPRVARAMWLDTLVDGSVFREWILNVGGRDGRTRMAHLLCEIAVRLETEGLGSTQKFELPLTQEQLADATGLTAVHVNRVLQALTLEGLISRTRRSITISDWARLARAGDFSPAYLHPHMQNALG